MTIEEVRQHLVPDLDAIYVVIVVDENTFRGPIEGPYRGYLNSREDYRREDYIYIRPLNEGLVRAIPIVCSAIISIEVE